MAAIARVLDAMGRNDQAAIEGNFAQYLQQFPRSARGYFLLGLWRLHGESNEDGAAVAFRHAFELDPGYMPAAHNCIGLLAGRGPAEVEAFLKAVAARIEDKDIVRRLEDFARQPGPARGTSPGSL
jgi:lipoprotein NlpI